MKIALIGLGEIAKFQIEAINKIKEISISDVFDLNLKYSPLLPASTKFHSSLDKLIQQSKADIFLISTPTKTHYKIASSLLNKGKNILFEKPMCCTIDELNNLHEINSSNKVFISTAFHASYGQEIIWWKQYVNNNDLGNMIYFHTIFSDPYMDSGKIKEKTNSLLGSWYDSGINSLGIINELVMPNSLKLIDSTMFYTPEDIQSSSYVTLEFADKNNKSSIAQGAISTNWNINKNLKLTRLRYDNIEVILHHSLESIFIVKDNYYKLLINLKNRSSRLTNQYVALFKDLLSYYKYNSSNFEQSYFIHKILIDANNSSRKHEEQT